MNGNQGGIGNYSYLAGMTVSKVTPTADNLYPGLAIAAGTAANKELTWEKTAQWNMGLDITLWNGRLIFSADAYYKKTTDLRSEEHTSELQSRQYLVCRLLLEKKKTHMNS